MKLFIDSANLEEIKRALSSGCVRGVTTNPSLMAKEPKGNYLEHIRKIKDIIEETAPCIPPLSLSVETFSDDPIEITGQALEIKKTLDYSGLAIKVHISHDEKNNLEVIRNLSLNGIAVNATACMTPMQATMAAAAGAKYVSLFYNRIRDSGKPEFDSKLTETLKNGVVENSDLDPNQVIKETRSLMADYPKAEIVVGSIRSVVDVKQAGLAGAHIVTVPPKILWQATQHFQTDNAIDRFFGDFKNWIS